MDDSVQEVSKEGNQWAGFIEGENVIRRGREILLQGFNWESHKHKWWPNLEEKIPHIAKAGFTSIWLPPAFDSLAPQGYLPRNIYSLNSAYGSENQLKSLLVTMENSNVRAMADIVINHRVGSTQGCGGLYNRYDGLPLPWDERAVTSCTGGLGNLSTGENFDGVPNIDHTQDFVRKDIKEWLIWLRKSVGFQDFRFDFAKGFAAKFVREYVEASDPMFAVGEYWVSCNYEPSSSQLAYNQDSHRQKIIDWINGTGGVSAAFDFTTKGILQEAVRGEWWRLRDCKGKPSGVLGWWPSRAVTFVENHDTGSTQAHWVFPSDHIMEACISEPWIAPLVNGRSAGFFKATRGLRQGYPMSPLLFVIQASILSFHLNKQMQEHEISGISIARGVQNINHALFADDTLLLGTTSIHSAIRFKEMLDEYCMESGSSLNKGKCHTYCWNTPPSLLNIIARCLGFAASSDWTSFKYLGLPIFLKRAYSGDWMP